MHATTCLFNHCHCQMQTINALHPPGSCCFWPRLIESASRLPRRGLLCARLCSLGLHHMMKIVMILGLTPTAINNKLNTHQPKNKLPLVLGVPGMGQGFCRPQPPLFSRAVHLCASLSLRDANCLGCGAGGGSGFAFTFGSGVDGLGGLAFTGGAFRGAAASVAMRRKHI